MAASRACIIVCTNRRFGSQAVSCAGRGSVPLVAALAAAAAARGLPVAVEASICQGRCGEGPNARFVPGPVLFDHVGAADISALLDAVAAELDKSTVTGSNGF